MGDGRQENRQTATTANKVGSISANYLRGIREYLIRRQLDVGDFFGEFVIGSDSLEDASKRVALNTYQAMLARAGELADDENIGLHVGECIKPAQTA